MTIFLVILIFNIKITAIGSAVDMCMQMTDHTDNENSLNMAASIDGRKAVNKLPGFDFHQTISDKFRFSLY